MTVGLFLGLTTVDLLFGLEYFPGEDTKNTAQQYVAAAGGPATNAAVVFARLGGRAHLLSLLGAGEIAGIASADLREQGIEHSDLDATRASNPPISAVVTSRRNGSRTILTSPAIDSVAPYDANRRSLEARLAESDILMLDGHQMKLATEAAQVARARGIPVVLDGDLYRTGIEELLTLVDVAIFGKSFEMPGCGNVPEILLRMGELGVRHAVATQGPEAVVFASGARSGTIAVATVEAVDTLAAGDFFHGAFCFRYAETADLEEALAFAAAVATRSVTSWGPRQWLASL